MTEHHPPPAKSHSHQAHSHHGHVHHGHAHHDHSHDGHHHDAVKSSAPPMAQERVMPPASFFALSALQRLGYVMPFIALIWLGLFWAMREGA